MNETTETTTAQDRRRAGRRARPSALFCAGLAAFATTALSAALVEAQTAGPETVTLSVPVNVSHALDGVRFNIHCTVFWPGPDRKAGSRTKDVETVDGEFDGTVEITLTPTAGQTHEKAGLTAPAYTCRLQARSSEPGCSGGVYLDLPGNCAGFRPAENTTPILTVEGTVAQGG